MREFWEEKMKQNHDGATRGSIEAITIVGRKKVLLGMQKKRENKQRKKNEG